ncbi:uncharacterized protein LY89DRAFT_215140 [Mollisia scopiformis]|uniref:Uncharacterized protein n=1 Tax=Mollisia scopiformis TaxID=149040 RepID=A0A194WW51_MOLSC|nr:uncharacterized protein LY89DRAFT_215140 [Mollisia scopiformis]KUJ11899.1 hypothetical protein LY89DRAFT_215140 [Mollisia scopiformis]
MVESGQRLVAASRTSYACFFSFLIFFLDCPCWFCSLIFQLSYCCRSHIVFSLLIVFDFADRLEFRTLSSEFVLILNQLPWRNTGEFLHAFPD